MSTTDKRFRIAFSFAGEKRDFVEKVARILADCFGEEAILYDKFHEAELARFDLGIYLPKLYSENCELIVPVLCPHYDVKRWTGWEWVHIYGLLTKADGRRVMPSRFDYAQADGLAPTAGFIELDDKSPAETAKLILERLALNEDNPRDYYVQRLHAQLIIPSSEKGPSITAETINTDRKKFFISYPQGDQDEENLAQYLRAQLTAAGHEAFIDVGMTAGTDWIAEIGSRIKWCDFLIVLLSARSMASEMVHTEVRMAHLRNGETGWPKIIPIRVRYFGPLEYELDLYLGGLQYIKWDGLSDSERVQQEVLRATNARIAENSADSIARLITPREPQPLDPLHRPHASRDTRAAAVPGGTIRSDDSCYIKRPQDEAVKEHAVDVGQTLVIKGPRQIGKSSLLVHYLSQCQTAGKKVAFVDFQIFSSDDLDRYTTFLSRFALVLQDRLKIKGAAPSIDSQFAMVQFIEQIILPAANGPLVIALDEVDRLLGRSYQSDFFSMLRLWHNNRSPLTPEWEVLDLALVVSTEPYLLIAADDRSPFNVGLLVQPQPFSKMNCRELNRRFAGVLTTVQVDELWNLLQGHPFLTRLSYYRLTAADRISFDELIDRADDERGPFGDHLRALLVKLAQTPELLEATKQLIRDGTKPNRDLYYRLFGAGLVQRDGDRVNPANLLYARYFRKAL